jgi:SAM-dependent methyltransferase
MTLETQASIACHVCGALHDGEVAQLDQGVTSDCRPWPKPLRMFCCGSCGTCQTVANKSWTLDCQSIYQGYDTYAAAGGAEQRVADAGGDALCGRSARIVAALRQAGVVPREGRLLDVGCGRGAFLREFGTAFPAWTMDGTEFDDKHRARLSRIPGFGVLHTGSDWPVGTKYNLISMIHVLEHFTDPVAALRGLARIAGPGCLLLVQVPDWTRNPFALTIADHATHFTADSLARIAAAAGWRPIDGAGTPVVKELTLLAKTDGVDAVSPAVGVSCGGNDEVLLAGQLAWLSRAADTAQRCGTTDGPLGIFGTAIAATWLHGAIHREITFFVDEDPLRQGHTHLGLPILAPAAMPAGARLIVPLAPAIAGPVLARLAAVRPDVALIRMPEPAGRPELR